MFAKAKRIFEDAQNYINPQNDPVMWDLVNGLAELAHSLVYLEGKIDQVENRLRQLHP